MDLITDIELDEYLATLYVNPKLYLPQMADIVNLQYKTGCRIGDILQFNRWSVLMSGNLLLQPQKDNNTREFEPTEVTPWFLDGVLNNVNPYEGIFYRKYEYHLKQITNTYGFFLGDKGICSHLFRHNYARQMKATGSTDTQIKEKLGERNQSSANQYIYSQIYWYKPA